MSELIIWFKTRKQAERYRSQCRPDAVVLPRMAGGFGVYPSSATTTDSKEGQ